MVASRSDSLSPSVVERREVPNLVSRAACILAITSPPRSLCPLNADGFVSSRCSRSSRTSSAAGTEGIRQLVKKINRTEWGSVIKINNEISALTFARFGFLHNLMDFEGFAGNGFRYLLDKLFLKLFFILRREGNVKR